MKTERALGGSFATSLPLHPASDPSAALRQTLSTCQLLKLTLETTFNLLKPEAAVLILKNPGNGRYEIRDFVARDPLTVERVIGVPNFTLLERTLRRLPYLLAVGKATDGFFVTRPSFAPLHTLFCTPARSGRELFGFIVSFLFSPESRVTEGQRAFLAGLAERAAGALNETRSPESLRDAFKQTIEVFALALEKKDSYTAGHSERTRIYASMIVDGLGFPAEEREKIGDASLLHDIGKLGLDPAILNNPGRLSMSDLNSFREHPTQGRDLLEPILFLSDLVPLVYHHHESFDGTGYPDRISGHEIPLGARIIAIADAYDAMTSHRAYRRALSHERAVRELRDCAGTQFDPDLVLVFLDQVDQSLKRQSVVHLIRNLAE